MMAVEILTDRGQWEPAVALATKDTGRGQAAFIRWQHLEWWAFRMGPDDVDEWRPVADATSREEKP